MRRMFCYVAVGILVAVAFIAAPSIAQAMTAFSLAANTLDPNLLTASALMALPGGDALRKFGRRQQLLRTQLERQNGNRRLGGNRDGVMKYPTRASSYPELFKNSNVTNANLPEAIPWIYYDQQNFATNWTSVNFFGAAQSDLTLGNIEQPNTIAGEQYFMLYAITFDFNMGATSIASSAAATQFDDARIMMETARATLSLTLAQKLVFRIPLAACHAIGGYQAWVAGTPSGSNIFNSVQNYGSDGGWWCDGAIILPPRQTFQFNVQGAASALTATRAGRLGLHGVLYRPVR